MYACMYICPPHVGIQWVGCPFLLLPLSSNCPISFPRVLDWNILKYFLNTKTQKVLLGKIFTVILSIPSDAFIPKETQAKTKKNPLTSTHAFLNTILSSVDPRRPEEGAQERLQEYLICIKTEQHAGAAPHDEDL